MKTTVLFSFGPRNDPARKIVPVPMAQRRNLGRGGSCMIYMRSVNHACMRWGQFER